jgi:hypothetical protein
MTATILSRKELRLRLRAIPSAPQTARTATAALCSEMNSRFIDNAVFVAGEMVRSSICRQHDPAEIDLEGHLTADRVTFRVRAGRGARGRGLALGETHLNRTLDLLRRLAQSYGYSIGPDGTELWAALLTNPESAPSTAHRAET